MRDFFSLYSHGFARVAACTLRSSLADPHQARNRLIDAATSCSEQGAILVVFPELCLSGYAIEDLRQQDVLLDAVEEALVGLAAASETLLPLMLVGAPLRHGDALFNCAVAIHKGEILGVVPKSFLPGYREFYENRQFSAGAGLTNQTITVAGAKIPFGTDLLFEASDIPGFCVGAEICEDIWVPAPPSTGLALAGATIIANLSASNITVGKAEERELLCRSQSARCHVAYLYAAAGEGESTTDVAWDGQVSIFENGTLLSATRRFPEGTQIACTDIDLDLLRQERLRMTSFAANASSHALPPMRRIVRKFSPPQTNIGFRRHIPRFPFVPADPARLQQDCYEACTIQVSALKQRLQATGSKTLVIGVSGGLDSTHALLVAVRAAEELGLGAKAVLGFTMPGFGTSDMTKSNAHKLMRALGITAGEIDIRPVAHQMLAAMEHPFAKGENVFDITFENVQAGLRTDFLFRIANQKNGIVIGTGDLSELALGWCTYGVGDQMSHYNVNSGLPKTLIQHLIRWFIASAQFPEATTSILSDILATEISPELIPASGGETQSTEATLGPYSLHDFTLFHILRYGFRPSKIAFMAQHAWADATSGDWPPDFPEKDRRSWDLSEITHWMRVFLHRYFTTSQFKRSAMPNGPKVLSGGSLSPRGDWRAPSDGNARIWLEELERNVPVK
ncbi:MAG: NAD(+) synthase [Acetobacter sp.]|nr:NAD(+) synthase [Acetobacter sp.]